MIEKIIEFLGTEPKHKKTDFYHEYQFDNDYDDILFNSGLCDELRIAGYHIGSVEGKLLISKELEA